ncbi:hypothetical protein [Burkholderia vietnamiensis]|uniref:hypothetical protein n=1 Tax=Burkholderia vietnamiensis TaxID=60552 RepID=UPI001CF33BBD|nr:hypothetical protein [Burkholderia vietnamiensis]MCA8148118.1 hypothetical protein [Burkholderia vietnamiensis]
MRNLLSIALALIGLTLGTAHAASPLHLLARDTQGHLTLNGVPLGVPVAAFAPACQGDPTAATAPCVVLDQDAHGWGVGHVYGLAPVLDGAGRPVFKAATLTTNNGLIDGVVLDFADARYVKVFRDATTDVLGSTTWKDSNGVLEWHGALHGVYLVLLPEEHDPGFGVVQEDPTP